MFREAWPALQRPPRKFRPVPGENPPILGRKFCSCCGRWRLLLDFSPGRYGPEGKQLYFQAHCRTCQTVSRRLKNQAKPRHVGKRSAEERAAMRREAYRRRRQNPEWVEKRREYQRFYSQSKRREAGIPARQWRADGVRQLSPHNGRDMLVDIEPFRVWLERLKKEKGEGGLAALAQEVGIDDKRLHCLLKTNKVVAVATIDKMLTATGSATNLWELTGGD